MLNQFDSPADLIAQLREHDDVEDVNRSVRNAILHALVNSLADRIAEETGQQLLLLAFMSAGELLDLPAEFREGFAIKRLPFFVPVVSDEIRT
jgi:hypothetical protein